MFPWYYRENSRLRIYIKNIDGHGVETNTIDVSTKRTYDTCTNNRKLSETDEYYETEEEIKLDFILMPK